MSDEEKIVLPAAGLEMKELLLKYRSQLADATAANEKAMAQVRQQLTTLERNQIGIRAQMALLTAIEKDSGLTPQENP